MWALASALFIAVGNAAALAAPGELDTKFGENGVAALPAGDRYDAQGAPLVDSSGRIGVAGLLKNASDRVFFSRFTVGGTHDAAYGNAGTVHTTVVSSARRAATASLGDGRVLVAGATERAGRIGIERYLASGEIDTTFGKGNGKITVDLGGTFAIPRTIVPLPGGKALLAVANDDGGARFTVLKITSRGLDTSFNKTGIVRIAFTEGPSSTHDLDIVPDADTNPDNDRIIVAGSVGTEGHSSSDAALALLSASGALVTSFDDDGKATTAAIASNEADHAVAVAADNRGNATIAGPAGGDGMVARFTSAGKPDSSFDGDGRRAGGFGATHPTLGQGAFSPRDLLLDPAGRPVIAGTTRFGGDLTALHRWSVARLTANGAFDESFAGGGRIGLAACDNRSGYGATGITAIAERLLVLGSCGDQGAVAVMRLFAANVLRSPLTLTIEETSEAAGRRRISLANLDPTAALGNTDAFSGHALRNAPLGRSPLGRSPLGRSPLGRSPLGRSPLGRSPLGRSPIGPVLLSSIPLGRSSWEEVLEGVIDVPWQTLTFDDVLGFAESDATLAARLNELTLADVPLGRSALGDLSYAALLFGWTPLEALPAPEGGWCEFIKTMPANCDNGYTLADNTLLHLEKAGNDLSGYYRNPISLRQTQFAAAGSDREAVLTQIPLNTMALERTPIGKVPASEVADLLACGSRAGGCSGTVAERQAEEGEGFSSASLGQLITKLRAGIPSLPDLTFGQVLVGLVPLAEIPYERAAIADILSEADFRDGDLQSYTAAITVDCDQATGLRADVTLPDGARYVPGSAKVNGADETSAEQTGRTLAVPLGNGCKGGTDSVRALRLTFLVEPGYVLGPVESVAEVLAGSESAKASATSSVDDSLDSPDTAEGAQEITEDQFVTGHISGAEDIDAYRFRMPAAGSTITVTMRVPVSKEGESRDPQADFDLFFHVPSDGVETSPLGRSSLRQSPLGRSPLGRSSVPDTSQEPGMTPGVLPPDSVQDMPLGRSPLGRSPLGRSSINRGGEPESVTYVVRESQAGKDAYIRNAGFNGSSSRWPYLLRVKVVPPAPAPACRPRSLQGAEGSSGRWPESVSAATESIILFDRRRFAGRFSEADAEQLDARLRLFASRELGGSAVVLPIESHPRAGSDPELDVDAAAAAWDENPCSAAKANEVVQRAANVLDDVIFNSDGSIRLKELRHLMIVGSDDIFPQARLADGAVLANESEYAADLVFGDAESALSGAARSGYIFSDDPIADLDPLARDGRPLYVPDLAVGRVVETAKEISDQLERFNTSQGILNPQTANVSGYDFLSDGSRAVRDALAKSLPVGFERIDETWNAQDALAGMNDSRRQFGSYNAHYDHYRAQPAADYQGTSVGLVHADDATPTAGSLLFNMGCHGGLNVPDIVVALPTGDDAERMGDWSQLMSRRNVLYAGNTGYGYGDTEAVAYSERLSALFAENLASKRMSSAQALMYAKQSYSAAMGIGDDYDAKSLNQFTFYGPPMYRVGAEGGAAQPALPSLPSGDSQLSATPLSMTFDLVEKREDRGSYWVARTGGEEHDPLVVQHRPIQPRIEKDVTRPGEAPVHGFLIDGMTTDQIDRVNPVFARPTIDLAAHEPEPTGHGTVFPAVTQSVRSIRTPTGRRDILDLVLGQYRDDEGLSSQILIRKLHGRELRSYSSDWEPPVIERVQADIVADHVMFKVFASDDSAGGTVLYRVGSDPTWRHVFLAPIPGAPGQLGASAAVPAGTTKVFDGAVQVNDEAGNVGQAKNKVVGHFARQGSAGGPLIKFAPAPPASGYYDYTNAPTITLDCGSDVTCEYSIDGSEYQPYTGPFKIGDEPGELEGNHVIRVRASDGTAAAAVVAIDGQAPVVTGLPTPSANEHGWYNKGPVTVRFTCADATSGVASCSPQEQTVDTEGRNSVTATATDHAGHSASVTVPINIDKTKPSITGRLDREPEYKAADPKLSWFKDRVTAGFACTDALSGIGFCTGDAELGDGANQSLDGRAVDRAGNESTLTFSGINVDAKPPAVAIASNQTVYVPGQLLRGTAADAGSGIIADSESVKAVTVQYTAQGIGVSKKVDAKVTCTDNPPELRRTCTWEAPLPTIGSYRAVATATDRVGHTADSAAVFFSVSLG